MEEIRAFVGHSFDQDDAVVVNYFLKCFDQLSNLVPRFSWEHAEDAEPKVVAEKVMSLIENKNVFIGICTKKERVIQPNTLKKRRFKPRQFLVGEGQLSWKTSDWIIQEIGLAKGRNLDIILLIESGVRNPGGLQSDLEYISFDRAAPEKSFVKILEMITALSPKSPSTAATAVSAQSASDDEQKDSEPPENDDWKTPKPEWTRSEYDFAFYVMIMIGDESGAETISKAYLATEVAAQDDNKSVWEAYCEYTRLIRGKGGSLARLKALAGAHPNSSGVWTYLALGFETYQDYEESARTCEAAAMKTQNEITRLKLLKNAAGSHARAGAPEAAAKVIDRMKAQVRTSGVGEEELLNALKEVAEVAQEDETLLAIMELIADLDPSDIDTRFSLALKHSNTENNDLALFHYLRIPRDERDSGTWNNLGVTFDHLDLSVKSVQAYRKSEEAGQTLAMSNLAQKLITAGFLPEAEQLCNNALKIEDYHEDITRTMTRLKEEPRKEDKKEAEILEKAKPISDFYTEYGRALSRVEPHDLAERWKWQDCSLDATLQGSVFNARGSYELQPSGLAGALLGPLAGLTSGSKTSPVRYQVEFHGSIHGCAIEGRVVREREDERQKVQSSFRSTNENESKVLMIVSDDGREIRVMERKQGTRPKFYTLIREPASL